MRLAVLALFLYALQDGTQCFVTQRKCKAIEGRYYKWDDRRQRRLNCRRCDDCPIGTEWNTTALILKSDEYGDLECYPCVPCKEGFYKNAESYRTCSPCLLRCADLHRYQDIPCGSIERGQCGGCFPGYTHVNIHNEGDTDPSDRERPCTLNKRKDEGKSENGRGRTIDRFSDESRMSTDLKDIVIIIVCCVVVVLVGMVMIILIKFVLTWSDQRAPTRSQQTGSGYIRSSTRLIQSNESNLHNDLETDAEPVTDIVRAELQSVSLQQVTIDTTLDHILQNQRLDVRITVDDHLLSIIATFVDVENTDHLFRLLDVHKQTVDAEFLRFEKGIISYKQYALNGLIQWVHQAGRDATLHVLCQALARSSCVDALIEVENELGNIHRI